MKILYRTAASKGQILICNSYCFFREAMGFYVHPNEKQTAILLGKKLVEGAKSIEIASNL